MIKNTFPHPVEEIPAQKISEGCQCAAPEATPDFGASDGGQAGITEPNSGQRGEG